MSYSFNRNIIMKVLDRALNICLFDNYYYCFFMLKLFVMFHL